VLRRVELRIRGRVRFCLPSAVAGCLTLSLLALGWVAQVAAQGMTLPGKFEVSPTGAATYTIPIAVPPGTGGMVPSLSIAYSSQHGNGLVGMGWHLEGLPAIGRCPRTMAQDGVHGSVNFDADDRFCLDGQRLVAISGTYGADSTEYRTEIESFAKIVSRGSAGTGPAWFEVWTKSGQRMEFGNTTDSRALETKSKTTVRDWMVNKVSDTKGNYFTVSYFNETTWGQLYPTAINYAGNAAAGLQPNNAVHLEYEYPRPDTIVAYHAGSVRATPVRLKNIKTYAAGTLVADYRLAYDDGPTTTGRSRLKNVTLCAGSGACLPATTFAWQSGTLTPTVSSGTHGSGYRPYLADFNGDGLADIMWDLGKYSTLLASAGTRWLWTSTGSGFTATSNFAGQDGKLSNYTPVIVDFNRDGRSDVFWYYDAPELPSMKWMSSNTGTFTIASMAFAPPEEYAPPRPRLTGLTDFNGDGRSDLLFSHPSKPTLVVIDITKSEGFFGTTTFNACTIFGDPNWDGCSLSAATEDINGDGLTDLVWVTGGSVSGKRLGLMQSKGDGTFVNWPWIEDTSLHKFAPYFIDANGDGKTDIVWDKVDTYGRSDGERRLWLGKGDGTFIPQTNLAGRDQELKGYRPSFGDFNGDGAPDILWVQADTNGLSTGSAELWLNKGDGTFTVGAGLGSPPVGYVPVLADFSGDGKTDIFWYSRSGSDTRSTGNHVLWLSDGVPPDLLTSITTGTGATVKVSYKSLTASTVYTKGGGATDPVVELQAAMSVVSLVETSNGIGGWLSTSYAYAGARAHLDGRGFLGFRQMTVTDPTGIVHTTSYRQDFPFTGLVASETKKLAAAMLNATTHTYGATHLGGTRFQAFLVGSQAASTDLDGSVLPTVTSTYQYDTYGNATQIVVSATDGHAKTTTNTYDNDTAKWLLGRLARASVASSKTTPAPPPPAPATDVVISASTNNLNLWDYLLANGLATAGTPGSWTVTILSNVVIGSTSTGLPALDTGNFPAGSVLKIINNGTVVGAGGKGGDGGDPEGMWATAGGPGGVALRAQVPVTITNDYRIWGGGGGGGGGFGTYGGGGGGGGAGFIPGGPGSGLYPCWDACPADGTLTSGGIGGYGSGKSGGTGGGPGEAGSPGSGHPNGVGAGGAAGPAVTGNSFITWATVGDRRGPLN
jgi:hypothetical protein